MARGVVEAVRSAVQDSLVEVGAPPRAVFVAAVSGGQDSVCLFDALGEVVRRLDGKVVLGHVEHGIRGAESVRDAAYVESLASQQGSPSEIVHADVPTYARRHRLGLEQAARAVRYQSLAGIAEHYGAWAVATGHTTDDLAETLLINIVRGTGTTGTRSIHPFQELNSFCFGPPVADPLVPSPGAAQLRVIRPLLAVTRAMTEEYCRARGLEFRDDPTNLDPAFLRNRIRHHLLPLLRTYNPAIVGGLAHLARIATDDETALEQLTDAAWLSCATITRRAVGFDWSQWRTLLPAIQRRLLRRSAHELGVGGWTFEAVESTRLLLESRPPGRSLMLAGGIRLATSRSGFRLRPAMGPPDLDQADE